MTTGTAAAIYPSLDGRGVFVTGGATGIGASIVAAFARQNARVNFVDVNAAAGEALCDSLDRAGARRPAFRETDVTDLDALAGAVRSAAAENGGLSVLVNNVGNDTRSRTDDLTVEFWRRMMAVNLDVAFFAAQAAAPALIENGGGSIINLSSTQAIVGSAGMACYVTAKSGLLGLTKALASDYGAGKVRVNAIMPGWVLTERQRKLWATPEAQQEWRTHCRLPGELDARDIASMALFLAADDSRMITAQNFVVDAGRT